MSEFLTDLIALEKRDDSGAILREELIYRSDHLGFEIIVPRGFDTDFASVPRWIPMAYALFGGCAKWAAVIHDFLYRECPLCVSRDDADQVLLEAMEVQGVPKWKRNIIWAGVRVGGARFYRPYHPADSKPEAL